MTRALLIGAEPAVSLPYTYVQTPPYEAVVVGSLTLSQALGLREEQVLQALAEGKPISISLKPASTRAWKYSSFSCMFMGSTSA